MNVNANPIAEVVVIREAYASGPDKVVAIQYGEDARDVIARHYPGAIVDNMLGFDTPDGGSYVYDRVNVHR